MDSQERSNSHSHNRECLGVGKVVLILNPPVYRLVSLLLALRAICSAEAPTAKLARIALRRLPRLFVFPNLVVSHRLFLHPRRDWVHPRRDPLLLPSVRKGQMLYLNHRGALVEEDTVCLDGISSCLLFRTGSSPSTIRSRPGPVQDHPQDGHGGLCGDHRSIPTDALIHLEFSHQKTGLASSRSDSPIPSCPRLQQRRTTRKPK